MHFKHNSNQKKKEAKQYNFFTILIKTIKCTLKKQKPITKNI